MPKPKKEFDKLVAVDYAEATQYHVDALARMPRDIQFELDLLTEYAHEGWPTQKRVRRSEAIIREACEDILDETGLIVSSLADLA